MRTRILNWITSIPEVVSLWRRFPVGSVELRTRYGGWPRPHYAYGVFCAAQQAKAFGIEEISVIEFGVAGGTGLLALQAIALEISRHFGIRISVLGFDTGAGMPSPSDYRDLPYVWGAGFYSMEPDKLRSRLDPSTQLILGDVKKTIVELGDRIGTVGFIAFDLDYYSSTRAAFTVFDSPCFRRLPRVYCYFDDIKGSEFACHNEYIGEMCAIREFNVEHPAMKICPINMLRWNRPHAEAWNEQMYVLHDFRHPLYCTNLADQFRAGTQLPLKV